MDFKKQLKTTSKHFDTLNINWIRSFKDLFQNFPRAYEDRSDIKNISSLEFDKPQTLRAKVVSKKPIIFWNWRKIREIIVNDENDFPASIQYRNSPFMASKLKVWEWYLIIWKPKLEKWKVSFSHPDIAETTPPETTNIDELAWNLAGRIVPIYSEIGWIKSSWFAKRTWDNLALVDELFPEFLPLEILEKYNLPTLNDMIKNLHYPEDKNSLKQAQRRLFFDKLLRIQISSKLVKDTYQNQAKLEKTQAVREVIKQFLSKLPFELTKAQKRAIKEIIDDTTSDKPMLRLLQWDVGSWKTLVAAAAGFYEIQNWSQVAFLAPTEVLAQQHYRWVAKYFLPIWIPIALLTGSTTASEKQKIKAGLADWNIKFVVWTHALLQEDVDFKNLSFVVIDEQHKFGVKQRWFFQKFGSPHILQMTATPIPRSLTLAFFGEFDTSILDEMPAWRKQIATKAINEEQFYKLENWINTKISQGQKIYVVVPLVEESESLEDVQSVITEYENISNLFPQHQVELLHWKMTPKLKDEAMQKFKWSWNILVSTTVIEVWVDVPEATVIIIKNAERFGLSQLHQLRWRVWRNDLQSYCFLVSKKTTKRLKAMEETNDGFKLSQIDLEMRWAWELLWTRQSWETDVPYEIMANLEFLEQVKNAAVDIIENHKDWLEQEKNKNWIGNKWGILV